MRYPPSILDEIRARLPVSQVVGRHVRLKRQGREYAGLSPFKHEKTPSFFVNDEKGFYHCFASGEHGDIFKFLMQVEGLTFPEAVERLAEEASVPLPKPTPQAEAREEESVRLRKLMEAACAFFRNALQGGAGAEARAYLDRRGLTDVEVERFRLGYAPSGRFALKEHLAAKGFSQADMIASGMLIAGDDIPISYDRFRHRLIFPICDLRGGVIAFGGRALDSDQQPKYLNSPETPLFHKGSVLFNAASARRAAHDRGAVIVAEGYMDVIALTRAGFANSVAPLGTALTPDQLQLLWRMAPEPIMCFDGDSAGMKAAYRSVETALPLLQPGRSLAFAFLPDGLDPDDLLRQQGPQAVAHALSETRPLVDVLWAKELATGTWETPERRAQLETRLFELAATVPHKTVRHYYEQEIRRRLREHFRPNFSNSAARPDMRGKMAQQAGGFIGPKRTAFLYDRQNLQASLSRKHLKQVDDVTLLKLLGKHDWAIDKFYEDISAYPFDDPALRTLADHMLENYVLHGRAFPESDTVRSGFIGSAIRQILEFNLRLKVLSDEAPHDLIEKHIIECFERKKRNSLSDMILESHPEEMNDEQWNAIIGPINVGKTETRQSPIEPLSRSNEERLAMAIKGVKEASAKKRKGAYGR